MINMINIFILKFFRSDPGCDAIFANIMTIDLSRLSSIFMPDIGVICIK